jgi:HPt (histidine-containing phosphotransfer) domain-containing protein
VLGKFGLTVDSTLAPAGVDVLLSTPANAPVDLEQLLALTDYDPAFVRELVSAFVVSAAQIARELKESAQRDDRAATMRAAHKLRGASANLYARALSKLCAELETEATEWTRPEIAEQIAAIEVAIEQATDYLQRNQPESSDAYRQNAQR